MPDWSVGMPPRTAPPPIDQPGRAAPGAGAPHLAPEPAVRQLKALAGQWYCRTLTTVWRYAVSGEGFKYDFEELGGQRRVGKREFAFSLRGALCRAGHELRRIEKEEDVVTGDTTVFAAVGADGAVWHRRDPRGSESPSTDSGRSSSSGSSGSPSSSRRSERPTVTVHFPKQAAAPAAAKAAQRRAPPPAAPLLRGRGERSADRAAPPPQGGRSARAPPAKKNDACHVMASVLVPLISIAAETQGDLLNAPKQIRDMVLNWFGKTEFWFAAVVHTITTPEVIPSGSHLPPGMPEIVMTSGGRHWEAAWGQLMDLRGRHQQGEEHQSSWYSTLVHTLAAQIEEPVHMYKLQQLVEDVWKGLVEWARARGGRVHNKLQAAMDPALPRDPPRPAEPPRRVVAAAAAAAAASASSDGAEDSMDGEEGQEEEGGSSCEEVSDEET
eukprot:gene13372-16867_t